MKLNNLQRAQLKMFLPESGNMADIATVLGIIQKIDFTEEDVSRLGIELNGNVMTWKQDEEIEVKFSLSEKNLLLKVLNQKDAEGSLQINAMDLYTKIKQLENE